MGWPSVILKMPRKGNSRCQKETVCLPKSMNLELLDHRYPVSYLLLLRWRSLLLLASSFPLLLFVDVLRDPIMIGA